MKMVLFANTLFKNSKSEFYVCMYFIVNDEQAEIYGK